MVPCCAVANIVQQSTSVERLVFKHASEALDVRIIRRDEVGLIPPGTTIL